MPGSRTVLLGKMVGFESSNLTLTHRLSHFKLFFHKAWPFFCDGATKHTTVLESCAHVETSPIWNKRHAQPFQPRTTNAKLSCTQQPTRMSKKIADCLNKEPQCAEPNCCAWGQACLMQTNASSGWESST